MEKAKISISNLSFRYANTFVLKGINVEFYQNKISAIIGPSGAGKTTLLFTINRLWEEIPDSYCEGDIYVSLNGKTFNINDKNTQVLDIRKKIAIVFQIPNPLPMSVYDNLAFPLKICGIKSKSIISQKVHDVLVKTNLFSEIKDRLNDSALKLSTGQQQRLCIARALIAEPEILLLDEPTSSLDEKNKSEIENLIKTLKNKITVILVSHFNEQVSRIADYKYILQDGKLTPII